MPVRARAPRCRQRLLGCAACSLPRRALPTPLIRAPQCRQKVAQALLYLPHMRQGPGLVHAGRARRRDLLQGLPWQTVRPQRLRLRHRRRRAHRDQRAVDRAGARARRARPGHGDLLQAVQQRGWVDRPALRRVGRVSALRQEGLCRRAGALAPLRSLCLEGCTDSSGTPAR